jgi:hypothetical protein
VKARIGRASALASGRRTWLMPGEGPVRTTKPKGEWR